MGVLAIALGHSAPPRVSCDVHHRGKGPFDADGRTLSCSYPATPFHKGRVEGGGLGEGDGEDGSVAVDDVPSEDEGDFESGLLHDYFLNLVGILNSPDVDDGANSSVDEGLYDILGDGFVSTGHLEELSYFFFDGHDAKIFLDGFLDILIGFDFSDHGLKLLKIKSLTFKLVKLLFAHVETHWN